MAYTTEQLSNMQCISDVALRYCRGVDRLDADRMQSAYWGGATDDHGVFVGDAWEFCGMCVEALRPSQSANQCVLKHAIELIDAHAVAGEVYNVTNSLQDAQPVRDLWAGRYRDKYEKRVYEGRIIDSVGVHEGRH